MAGICGAVTAATGHVAVCGFYGWSVGQQPALLLATGITGFCIVYGVYLRRRSQNARATRAECAHIVDMQVATDSPSVTEACLKPTAWRGGGRLALNDDLETMAAHVTALLPRGGRRVRLVNGHELDVLGPDERTHIAALIGDAVWIERGLAPHQGWRLSPNIG